MSLTWQIKQKIKKLFRKNDLSKYGHISPTALLPEDIIIYSPSNLFMYEHTSIQYGAVIMNWRAKFIMKKYSGAAFGLKVISGNHMRIKGKWFKEITDADKDILDTHQEYDKDIIVDEDVWIGSNVTLLNGAHVGRGCNIGSGSVIRGSVPPYSIVVGNPCKVVGFVFTPDEIIEHEQKLYSLEERLPIELLNKNYNKYFLDRIADIKEYMK